jgi:hypothetical protein
MKNKFQSIVNEYFNPNFKVVDYRQDPAYGYQDVYLVDITDGDIRMALLVDTKRKEYDQILDEVDLEDGKTIWDFRSRG